jgi:NitT/TauT family transport system ATP-binding protein
MSQLNLPSYKEQTAEVAKRFGELKQRPDILTISGLSKIFGTVINGKVVLDDINFSTKRREFISVIGPSGCGKSTLIRILAGLETHEGGTITLDGESISGPGPERGMVFQDYSLFPWLTVCQNIMFGLEMRGEGSLAARSQALQWIELVGLTGYEDYYPSEISGGMKQRVAIARALANKPRVLLMDEPFGALDAQTRSKMQAYLLEIWRKVDITIVFITHDLDEAVYLSDRILVLEANPGKVAELIEVPVPRPRGPEQFINPEFLATKNRLEELIHPKSLGEETHMIKLTLVGDEIT